MKKLTAIWRALLALPELVRRVRELELAVAHLEEFELEIGESLAEISRAGDLLTSGYLDFSARQSLAQELPSSIELVDEQISSIRSALLSMRASPAIGSREIGVKQTQIGAAERELGRLEDVRRRIESNG